jgi:polyribonucleotide nucleotidyltransferase
MTKTISEPREDYKPFVPRIVKITIPRDFIGAVIGPGGKIIQEMQRETNTIITITEEGEFGIVDIASPNKESIERAIEKIRLIVAVPEVGEVYQGKIKSILDFGAFIEILPGKEGLLHISEIDHKRILKVSDELRIGDTIEVKLLEIDAKSGKLKLSRKALLPRPPRQDRPDRPDKFNKPPHKQPETQEEAKNEEVKSEEAKG